METRPAACEFIMAAICLICKYGKYFLPLYEFDIHTGNWRHRSHQPREVGFGLEQALAGLAGRTGSRGRREPGAKEDADTPVDQKARKALYDRYLQEAETLGEKLKQSFDSTRLRTTEKDLIPFVYV